jgi:orotate phosphoribosyltransferase
MEKSFTYLGKEIKILLYKYDDYIKNRIYYKSSMIYSPRISLAENHFELYKAIAKFLTKKKVKTITGPVLSGALMAHAIALSSSGKLDPQYLDKPEGRYSTDKHSNYPEINKSYALVDDIVSSGKAIIYAAQQCLDNCGEEPKYIIVLDIRHKEVILPKWIEEKIYVVVIKDL